MYVAITANAQNAVSVTGIAGRTLKLWNCVRWTVVFPFVFGADDMAQANPLTKCHTRYCDTCCDIQPQPIRCVLPLLPRMGQAPRSKRYRQASYLSLLT